MRHINLRTRIASLGIAVLIAVILFAWLFSPTHVYSRAHGAQTKSVDVIPNRVHYVHIMTGRPSSKLQFEFKHFVSIYSAALYFQPDVIFIHTDASYESIEQAHTESSPEPWTRLIFNLPSVVVRHVATPEKAGNGLEILRIEHKSDFVRAKVVYEHGGMYLDWDVYALRDVKTLRESGYANVLGRQKHGAVNSGCWMSKKGTKLMDMWVRGQNEIYNGGWTVHSNDLLGELGKMQRNGDGNFVEILVDSLAQSRKEVLILDQVAFAPSSWEVEDATTLFQSHQVVRNVENATGEAVTQELELEEANLSPWEIDYSDSYVLHAFKAAGNAKIENFDPEGITLQYVLKRQSNFARAVYPAVRHAIDARVIAARYVEDT